MRNSQQLPQARAARRTRRWLYIASDTQKRYVSPFVRSTSRRSDDGSVYSIRYFCPAQHGVAYDSYVHTVSTPHDTGNDRTRCALRSRAASVFVSATGHSGHSVRLRSTLHASMTNTFYTHMKDIWDALSTVNGTACARTCECCEDALSSLHCNGGCRGMISGRGFFWRTHRWDARRGATWATPGTTSMWSQAEKCLQLQVILLCVVIRDRKHRDSVRR